MRVGDSAARRWRRDSRVWGWWRGGVEGEGVDGEEEEEEKKGWGGERRVERERRVGWWWGRWGLDLRDRVRDVRRECMVSLSLPILCSLPLYVSRQLAFGDAFEQKL